MSPFSEYALEVQGATKLPGPASFKDESRNIRGSFIHRPYRLQGRIGQLWEFRCSWNLKSSKLSGPGMGKFTPRRV
jgi:hypothetical protein